MVFRVSLLLIVALSIVAGVAPVRFGEVTGAALAAVIAHAGWMYLLIVFLTLLFLAWLAFGPAGRRPRKPLRRQVFKTTGRP